MVINATKFKTKSLALIDRVHRTGEPIFITKHDQIVAKLVFAEDTEEKPWLALRGKGAKYLSDPFASAVDEEDITVFNE